MKQELQLHELDEIFTLNGCKYQRVHENRSGYVYERKNQTSGIIESYEVFEKRKTAICLDFENRIYSDTEFKEVFPKDKDFGVWAWAYRTKERAIQKLHELT